MDKQELMKEIEGLAEYLSKNGNTIEHLKIGLTVNKIINFFECNEDLGEPSELAALKAENERLQKELDFRITANKSRNDDYNAQVDMIFQLEKRAEVAEKKVEQLRCENMLKKSYEKLTEQQQQTLMKAAEVLEAEKLRADIAERALKNLVAEMYENNVRPMCSKEYLTKTRLQQAAEEIKKEREGE